MNAQRKDSQGDNGAPQDAMAGLVRATAEAMETFMNTDWVKDAEKAGSKVNPLMSNPAAMMAAATAMGLQISGQWAGLMLEAMQGANAEGAKTEAEVEAQPKAPATESVADDLKRISGIGPKLEKVLAGRGVGSFKELAALDEAAVQKLDEELGLDGRIIRDDWIGQARNLLGEAG